MEAITRNLLNIMVVVIFQPVSAVEYIVRNVFEKFNFQNELGLLQFWSCIIDPDSDDLGCNIKLTNITRNPTQDQALEDYRKICLEKLYPFVGIGSSMGNWSVGRAAQTGIADQRTKHHVLHQDDQHSADVGNRGQLVLPVFFDEGDGNKLAGVIEYVTTVRKDSYIEDFEQIHRLLKDVGLKSNYMGKTIKVVYNGEMIKFRLPLSAKFTNLHTEVTKRFMDLVNKKFRVEYENSKGTRFPISSDEVLRVCMDESSSKGENFIKMRVLLEHKG